MPCFGGSGGDASAFARQQQQDNEAKIQQGLGNINNAFSGFNQGFFNQRAQDYTNYAMPQLQQQALAQQKGLNYNLAGQGLLRSSAGQDLNRQLGQQVAQQRQGVINAGQTQAQQLQQTVAGQKSNLVGQLEASADPAAASQNALGAAASFSAPSAFAPVGNLFSNWANIYSANALSNSPGFQPTSPFGFGGGSNFNRGFGGYTAPTTLSGGR